MPVTIGNIELPEISESDLGPPDQSGRKASRQSYNHPMRYYKRPDEGEPCGYSIIKGPGDPESYIDYVSDPEEGGRGWEALSPTVAKRELRAQAERRNRHAAEINAQREKEAQEKGHPTVIVAGAEAGAAGGVTLTAEEYKVFRSLLEERDRKGKK